MKIMMVTFAITLVAVASAAIVGKGALRASGSLVAAPLAAEADSAETDSPKFTSLTADKLLHLLNADEQRSEQTSLPWMENKGEPKEMDVEAPGAFKEKKSGDKENEEQQSVKRQEKSSQAEDKKNNDKKAKKEDQKDQVDKDKGRRRRRKKDAPAVKVEGNFDDFLPGCLVHTAEIVHSIDASYTDMMIQNVLENECLLNKEFPTVVDHGFDNHKACMYFARSLSNARHAELADGSTDGYKTFCKEFYQKKTATIPGLDKAGVKAAERGFNWVWRVWVIVIAFGLFLAGVAAIAFMKKRGN